jgi:DNA-binding MarR family transcriptional regulator
METSRDILATVVTLARLIRVEADKRARAHGMTRAQWQILLHVDRQPGLLQKELAEVLEVEPISVARLVDRLEARGMVERRGDPMDRRCWRLHLTDAARPLLSEINIQLDGLAGILCADIDHETASLMARALDRMREAIAQELRNAPPPPPEAIVACADEDRALHAIIESAH